MEPVNFEFDKNASPAQQSIQVLDAAANGDIPPDVAQIFINAIKSNIDIEAATELKERIEKLEALLGTQS